VYLTYNEPPEKRRAAAVGGVEHYFSEAAVMLAFALHLLERDGSSGLVHIHPDGQHALGFDIVGFLWAKGFVLAESLGSTAYGGRYARGGEAIVVRPTSGHGDVLGEINGRKVVAECKGGVINSRHPGQKSRMRRGLSELIGQLMVLPADGARQVAVLPNTPETERLARRLSPRCASAGIELALVESDGAMLYVS
jgi:hypothetical protein